jgi:hypothetical protein
MEIDGRLGQRVGHERVVQPPIGTRFVVDAGQVRLVHDLLLEREVRTAFVGQRGAVTDQP